MLSKITAIRLEIFVCKIDIRNLEPLKVLILFLENV